MYTDTDSLILYVNTDNFYNDIQENSMFDTSNYNENNINNIYKNKSFFGRMEDEFAGKAISTFIDTCAKAYCLV